MHGPALQRRRFSDVHAGKRQKAAGEPREPQPDAIVAELGLQNCQNTVVGDAMLRGVSSGERKRVTTGEMQFGVQAVSLKDEIITGLGTVATFDRPGAAPRGAQVAQDNGHLVAAAVARGVCVVRQRPDDNRRRSTSGHGTRWSRTWNRWSSCVRCAATSPTFCATSRRTHRSSTTLLTPPAQRQRVRSVVGQVVDGQAR